MHSEIQLWVLMKMPAPDCDFVGQVIKLFD